MGTINFRSLAPITEITVLLANDQVFTLDEVAAVVRRNTGNHLSRSAIMRAIVASVLPHYQDWLKCGSEGRGRLR